MGPMSAPVGFLLPSAALLLRLIELCLYAYACFALQSSIVEEEEVEEEEVEEEGEEEAVEEEVEGEGEEEEEEEQEQSVLMTRLDPLSLVMNTDDDDDVVTLESSCTGLQLQVPTSPPHASPACDPLPCLTSLCHSLLLSGALLLPSPFSHGLLLHPTGQEILHSVSVAPDGVADTIGEGLPVHPLYVHLAAALYRWICRRQFPRDLAPIAGISEDESWKSRLDAWTDIVVTHGSALLQLWQGVAFQLDVQEPYSSLLKDGHKVVEGRCATNSYRSLRSGDLILVNESFLLLIKEICWYPTFQAMIEAEGLPKVLPGVDSISEGVKVYGKFYTEAKERAHGVLGIHVVRPAQKDPVDLLSDILNALGIDGVRALLGMRTTIGTLKEALPPPMSLLVDSFSARQNPDVASCLISVGARALAKHVPRSCDGWWGNITGTEAEKNKLAEKTLRRLMMQTVWMNVHLAPIPLFEIRVSDGYGARWLADGSQFRGFLEPPMEEGYMKKWRH